MLFAALLLSVPSSVIFLFCRPALAKDSWRTQDRRSGRNPTLLLSLFRSIS
ncbi:hypothetical protein HMPREF1986_02795 [Oribacterium sp. oral taxon 078 str. F0263]|nr:hypothetical protein HMPREF1986_02795 [Oribacterium sp. oral taxon 078 str. F0263]